MPLIDSHCHLDLYPNFVELLEKCEKERIYTLAVTTTPKAWPRNFELTVGKQYVRAALGFHPQLVNESWQDELNTWEKYLSQAKYIGEVGIDAGKNFSRTLPLQQKVFRRILELCAKDGGNKVLSVHSVNSASLILDLIEEILPSDRRKVILHWFTGTNTDLKRAIDLDCYFSVNHKMVGTIKGQALLDLVPINKLLTETDGPFIHQNGKPVEPFWVIETSRLIAFKKRMNPNSISQIIFENFMRLSIEN
jgi:TatD DNase family protein